MDVRKIWKESKYTKPNYPLCMAVSPIENENGEVEWFSTQLLVVDDHSTIYTLLDEGGNIYYVASSKCEVEDDKYFCIGPLYFSPSSEGTEKIEYARKEILPVVFNEFNVVNQ